MVDPLEQRGLQQTSDRGERNDDEQVSQSEPRRRSSTSVPRAPSGNPQSMHVLGMVVGKLPWPLAGFHARCQASVAPVLAASPGWAPSISEECPGKYLALGSTTILAPHTAIAASPNPVAMSFSLPG